MLYFPLIYKQNFKLNQLWVQMINSHWTVIRKGYLYSGYVIFSISLFLNTNPGIFIISIMSNKQIKGIFVLVSLKMSTDFA